VRVECLSMRGVVRAGEEKRWHPFNQLADLAIPANIETRTSRIPVSFHSIDQLRHQAIVYRFTERF